ncbi:RAMP superfamily CRISPR-associated protein [Helicobacter sp. 23-1044]
MGRNYRNYGNHNNRGGGNQQNKNNYNAKSKGNQNSKESPYKFIEPNETVFYPQEFGEVADDKISFEKPFSDSQSGILELTIIAKSDIFAGGFEGKNADNKTTKAFFKIGDKYALSGSSVRGVIRTISQVLSFGKFQTNAPEEYIDKDGNVTNHTRHNFDKDKETRLDMTERIFGAIITNGSKNFSLKSRISFSHFFIATNPPNKATYENNSTYNITDPVKQAKKDNKPLPKFCKENGFRFYEPLQNIRKPNGKIGNNISSTISPLGAGTEFVGKLRYFNLTKAELGLVLLCLTALDNNKGEYYKFGGAKFYGYGDTQIKLNGISESLQRECIEAYKNLLAKTDFELDSRINDLRKVSKKQSVDSANKPSQNNQTYRTHGKK